MKETNSEIITKKYTKDKKIVSNKYLSKVYPISTKGV